MNTDVSQGSPVQSAHQDKKQKDLQIALDLLEQNRLDEAIRIYNTILVDDPTDKTVWNNLGVALRKKKLYAASAACYEKAIFIDPTWVGALTNYVNVLRDLDRLDEALSVSERILQLYPDNGGAHHAHALTLRLVHQHDLSLWHLERAVALAPKHVAARWDLVRARLARGDYKHGWREYEVRNELGEMKKRSSDQPAWRGEDLAGKTIILYAEQGFGDTLLGLRFALWVKNQGADKVLFECPPALTTLVGSVAGLDEVIPLLVSPPPSDYQCSLMDLPALYGLTLHNIPRLPKLSWEQDNQKKLQHFIDAHARPTDLKVGIVWSGSVTFKNNHKRSAELGRFLRLAEIPNVRLFSLQKGPPLEELQNIGCASLVVDLGSHFKDFSDTAAALQSLDLVVMTDSSVAHLAGSLDVPVWNLLDVDAYWLYMHHREDTPWYPSMRFYRQPKLNDWDSVFERVAGDLEGIAARKAGGQKDLRMNLLPHLYAAEGR